MDYCLVVKESMRRRLDRSRHQASLNGCVWRAGAIWRVTEREVMRSITESEGSQSMDGVKTTTLLVAMRLRDTPVPNPNTKVKT